MDSALRNFKYLLGTARLYARVGLSRMTFKKVCLMSRYWISTALLGRRIPWLIEFSVTYRCQCRCKHCSVSNYFDEADVQKELSTEKVKEVLQEAVKIGVPKLDYFGGEPLLRKDIVELVKYGSDLGLYISVTTNGWQLDRELLKKLKDAGISCINVSLDSTDEEEHDRLRGLKGIYQRAVAAIRLCHEEGVACIVSTYATRRRIQGFALPNDSSMLGAIIKQAKELKATGIRILFPIIAGEWVKKKEIELNEEEKKFVIENIDHSFAFIEGAYSVVRKKKVCQALSGKMLNISPYGEMQLCVAFPTTFGSLKEKDLKTLITQMWNHPIYLKNQNSSCCSTEDLKV